MYLCGHDESVVLVFACAALALHVRIQVHVYTPHMRHVSLLPTPPHRVIFSTLLP